MASQRQCKIWAFMSEWHEIELDTTDFECMHCYYLKAQTAEEGIGKIWYTELDNWDSYISLIYWFSS